MRFHLPAPIRDIVTARDRLRAIYRASGLTFTLDGNLLGDIGEAVAAQLFGLRLADRNALSVDGYAPDGRSVQVKAGASANGPAFRPSDLHADHLIVIRFDLEKFYGEVIYNGPERAVRALLPARFSGQRTVPLNRIKQADAEVEDWARLPLTDAGAAIVMPSWVDPTDVEGADARFIDRRAARDYLFLVQMSAAIGFIDEEELNLRVRVLVQLLPQGDALRRSLEDVAQHHDGDLFGDEGGGAGPPDGRDVEIGDPRGCGDHPEGDPPLMHFGTAAPRLGAWEFHPQDRDPKPSVPHGHWQGRKQPKLNPYTGRVYDKAGEVTRMRLSRKDMAALWNDRTFRRNVLEAIAWYSAEYPWHVFPVADPMRLPRR